MKRNKQIRNIAFDAMILSIIFVLTFVPNIGFISIGVVSFTTIHVIVLIGAYFGGIRRGWIYGLMFGLVSLLKAATMPVSILDPLFVNPLASVLPRLIFGFIAGAAFEFIRKTRGMTRYVLTFSAMGILTLIHGVITLVALQIFEFNQLGAALDSNNLTFLAFLGSIILTGTLPEAAVAMIISTPISIKIYPIYQQFMLE